MKHDPSPSDDGPDPGPRAVARIGQGTRVAPSRRGAVPLAEARPQGLETAQPPWSATAQYAQALIQTRRRRGRRLLGWFSLIVLAPTLATAVYVLAFAAPRYTSEFEFTYQTYRGPSSLASGLVQSVTGTSQQNTIDLGTIVYEFIRSPAFAEQLDRQLDLRRHFGDDRLDWFSRFASDGSRENFQSLVRSHIRASQGLGGYLTVSVTAFDREFAMTLAKAVVAACDVMVDQLTARARQNQVSYAEAELTRQEDRVRKARLALTKFQNQQGDQDPSRAASQLGTIVGSIEGDLAAARTQLSTAQVSLSPGSPIVVQLKQKVASLEDQLKSQQARLASDGPGHGPGQRDAAAGGKPGARAPYSEVLDDYAALQVEEEFARSAYLAAQQGVVVARADAAAKQNYLVDFAPPTLPDRPDYSYGGQAIVTVFLVTLLVFGLGSVAVGAARDQITG